MNGQRGGTLDGSGRRGALTSGAVDFIDAARLEALLDLPAPERGALRAVLERSLALEPLDPAQTALLLRAREPESIAEILEAARQLKHKVYGNRIVLFAPLYVGNRCVNECRYCAFRASNTGVERVTLDAAALRSEVEALEDAGHKRLILVFGEHPDYGPEFLAQTVRAVYSIRRGRGAIRRVNINAAPLDLEGFRAVKAAGIGTYQVFMETYHHGTYRRFHPEGTPKGDYLWRLDGLSRAMEAGCDDVGLGVLFGLHDWRFEALGLVAHACHLRARYGVGPHTLSFPRLRPAHGVAHTENCLVDDAQFKRLIAILRLAVPYTGLILTAREPAALRREVMAFGVSQIDAGSRIELGGYAHAGTGGRSEREQFRLADLRSLDLTMRELLEDGFLPSFCTACYRLGRTGEHFMEFAVPGFIKRFCTPNALATLKEYLEDYASPETKAAGEALIVRELERIAGAEERHTLAERLERIARGERDLHV